MFSSINTCADFSGPLADSQPKVPEVIPKVWLPEVPLVVAANTYSCHSSASGKITVEPSPQPAGPLAAAKATDEADAKMIPAIIFFICNSFDQLIVWF